MCEFVYAFWVWVGRELTAAAARVLWSVGAAVILPTLVFLADWSRCLTFSRTLGFCVDGPKLPGEKGSERAMQSIRADGAFGKRQPHAGHLTAWASCLCNTLDRCGSPDLQHQYWPASSSLNPSENIPSAAIRVDASTMSCGR